MVTILQNWRCRFVVDPQFCAYMNVDIKSVYNRLRRRVTKLGWSPQQRAVYVKENASEVETASQVQEITNGIEHHFTQRTPGILEPGIFSLVELSVRPVVYDLLAMSRRRAQTNKDP